MSALSDAMESAVADWIAGGATPTRPSARFAALYTAAPTDAGGGTEVSGGSYARTAVTFGAAVNGVTSNSATVTFPTATASWGVVTHFAVWDAATAGVLLFHGILTASKTIDNGDTPSFAATTLSLTMA